MALHLALPLATSSSSHRPWPQRRPQISSFKKQQELQQLHSPRFANSIDLVSVQQQVPDYFKKDLRPIILFDGVCNLCNTGVNIVLDNDPKGNLRFAALQSEAGKTLLQRCGRDRNDISSIVLVEKNRSFIKSEAVLRIANYLQQPFPLIAAFAHPFPLLLKDIVYDTVAANRYNIFGKTYQCRLSDGSFEDRFITE